MPEELDYMDCIVLKRHPNNLEQKLEHCRHKTPLQQEHIAHDLLNLIREVQLTICANVNVNRKQLQRALQLYARARGTIGDPLTQRTANYLGGIQGWRESILKHWGHRFQPR